MSKYIGPVCKLCRREGVKLFLKGNRCESDKCAIERRPKPPGMHGARRRKMTGYGLQLREKQKLKRKYGLLEKQFHHTFVVAEKMKGITGLNLLQLLERRIDNLVYRVGLANSRRQARQMVKHGWFFVNGRKVDLPGFTLKEEDVLSVKPSDERNARLKEIRELTSRRERPELLLFDENVFETKIARYPMKDEIDASIQEQLIVELYSR